MHRITRLLDIISPIYDPLINFLLLGEKKYRTTMIEFAEITPIDIVLDLGCGTGEMEVYLSKIIPCKNIYGVDISKKMIKITEEKMKKLGCDAHFFVSNSMPLPFEDNTFNIVFSSMVLHHFTDEEKIVVLKEIYRILKPNGKYVSAEFDSRRNPIVWLVSYNGILKEEHLIDAGFKIIKEEPYRLSILFRMAMPDLK